MLQRGSSVTGAAQATVYMEPQPVVELNNAEAMLADQVAEEELRILAALSAQAREPPWSPHVTSSLEPQRPMRPLRHGFWSPSSEVMVPIRSRDLQQPHVPRMP